MRRPSRRNVKKVNLSGSGSGNPYLKPITSDQEDITAEWYFAKNGSLTAAIFNKNLKNIIVNQAFNRTIISDNDGKPVTFVLNGLVNGAKGHARGMELAYQQYHDGLPRPPAGPGHASEPHLRGQQGQALQRGLYGLLLSGRRSGELQPVHQRLRYGWPFVRDVPLDNLSRNTFNIALLYDRGPVSARIAYNWRGSTSTAWR